MPATQSKELSAGQAMSEATAFVRRMNSSRRLPPVLPAIRKMMEENTVHIFNVGPWSHEKCLGSAGTWYIPACEDGKEYSAMRPIPGIVLEPIPVDEQNFQYLQDDGRYLAEQVVGVGKMQAPSNSLLKFGVFIAAGKAPTKEELDAARTRLREYYHELVQEARGYHNSNNMQIRQMIDNKHRLAAAKLNMQDEPWVVSQVAETRLKCPSCGTLGTPEQAICGNCKFILNEKKYTELQSRFAK